MRREKGKKGKVKHTESREPPHNPCWQRALQQKSWVRPVEALPDASLWPTWVALREHLLSNVIEICILFTKTLGDAFPAEILKLSPPCLQKLDFRGSPSLSQFLCAPSNSCICLRQVNLSNCDSLSFVLVQSRSIEFFDLSDCPRLKKVLVQCKSLGTLAVRGCSSLCTLMTWSESLENLDLSTCSALSHLDLICPKLSRRTLYLPDGCSLCTTAKANCRVAKFLWETSNGSRVGGENSIESIKTSGDDFDYFRYSKS